MITTVPGAAPPGRRALPFTRQLLLLQVGLLLVVVGLGFVLEFGHLQRALEAGFAERALDVARTLALDPELGDQVREEDQPAVAAQAAAVQRTTGALFVVITDARGIRLAHPNPAEIGQPVSTSPDEALHGREVTNVERGTLGLSVRGKVPLRDSTGTIVGEVSVGFDANDVSAAFWSQVSSTGLLLGVALALGIGGTLLLSRLLKRRTFGLEPADLADLVREREAVLYGISDGVIALDDREVVTMANAEATRLVGAGLTRGAPMRELTLPASLRRVLDERTGQPTVAMVGDRVLVATHRTVCRDERPMGSVLTVYDRTEVENLTGELGAVRMMTQALRAQRHEFANRLHTVYGLLHRGEPAEAAEYVDALIGAREPLLAEDSEAIAPATIRAFVAGKMAEAAEQGVELQLSEESWVPHKLLAPVEVITVLGNLVNNALEAAHEAPVRPARVVVDLLADGADLVLSVANTGTGIPPDRLATLFHDGATSHGPERGLGLAIVRRTVASLAGTVEVGHPGGDGALTVFVARLPQVLRVPARATS